MRLSLSSVISLLVGARSFVFSAGARATTGSLEKMNKVISVDGNTGVACFEAGVVLEAANNLLEFKQPTWHSVSHRPNVAQSRFTFRKAPLRFLKYIHP